MFRYFASADDSQRCRYADAAATALFDVHAAHDDAVDKERCQMMLMLPADAAMLRHDADAIFAITPSEAAVDFAADADAGAPLCHYYAFLMLPPLPLAALRCSFDAAAAMTLIRRRRFFDESLLSPWAPFRAHVFAAVLMMSR